MTKDCETLTVNSVSFVHGAGPVFYTSLPCGPSGPETLKHLLVSTLWDHLAAIESPLWKRSQSSSRTALPIQVVRGRLGRPHFQLGEYPGPAISFSEGGGKTWAALSGDESDIGMDVAEPDEFQGGYPFHRVFHPQELQYALRLADGDPAKASALIWSVKEAVVKALGCAFHLMDPLQITVYPVIGDEVGRAIAEAEDRGYTFSVDLAGNALMRFPFAPESLQVRSLLQGKMWLSIVLLSWKTSGNEYSPRI